MSFKPSSLFLRIAVLAAICLLVSSTRAENTADSLTSKVQACQSELSSAKSTLADSTQKEEASIAHLKELEARVIEIKNKPCPTAPDCKADKAKVDSLEKESAKTAAEVEQLQANIDKLDLETKQFEGENEALMSKNAELAVQLKELLAELEQVRAQNTNDNNRLAEMVSQTDAVSRSLADLTAQEEELAQEIEKLKNMSTAALFQDVVHDVYEKSFHPAYLSAKETVLTTLSPVWAAVWPSIEPLYTSVVDFSTTQWQTHGKPLYDQYLGSHVTKACAYLDNEIFAKYPEVMRAFLTGVAFTLLLHIVLRSRRARQAAEHKRAHELFFEMDEANSKAPHSNSEAPLDDSPPHPSTSSHSSAPSSASRSHNHSGGKASHSSSSAPSATKTSKPKAKSPKSHP